MCKVSDKIKFCTCRNSVNIEELDNYWVLYKFNKDKNEMMMGMQILPTSFRDTNFVFNVSLILDRLNDGEAFDKPIAFNKKDRLEVVLKTDSNDDSYSYNFQFGGKKWKEVEEDPFELMNYYDQEKEGKVKTN